MEWLKKFGAAIDYVEANLDKEISSEEAACIACCSPYYFQRLFSYISGVTLSEYIRRRKMTQAAFDLQREDCKVMEVALKYGYSSPTAFNRAFRKVHGIAPMEAKAAGGTVQAYTPMHLTVELTGANVMAYRITKKGPIRIVGIRISLTEDVAENWKRVPDFWKSTVKGKQFTRICQLSNQEPQGILGVSVYEKPGEIYYYIGVATDAPVPQGMYACEIPEALWVVFENEGNFQEDVQSIFGRFYREWLPFSGYRYAQLPDMEVYPMDIGRNAYGHSEVWIAIE